MLSAICHCQRSALASIAARRLPLAMAAASSVLARARPLLQSPDAAQIWLQQRQYASTRSSSAARRPAAAKGGRSSSSQPSRGRPRGSSVSKTELATNVPDRSKQAFKNMGVLCDDVKAALAEMKLDHPTGIQVRVGCRGRGGCVRPPMSV